MPPGRIHLRGRVRGHHEQTKLTAGRQIGEGGKNRSSKSTKNSAETPHPRLEPHEQNQQTPPSNTRDVEKTRPTINASGLFPRVLGKHKTNRDEQKSKTFENTRSNGNLVILGGKSYLYQ